MPVPVILFAYARPDHLAQTLASLRADAVPLLYVFSDGPRTPVQEPLVVSVRAALATIDWCEVVIHQHEGNRGLGRSIREGVTAVLREHDAALIVEDDLVFATGTYRYLCAALEHYRHEPRVMSVTGWTHPRVTPSGLNNRPYFDGRAECLLWGTWARAWAGMEHDALTLMEACAQRGLAVAEYGADLPEMAAAERSQNIWAVRWIYLHLLHGGVCLRPPHSLVDHIGFDSAATNSLADTGWSNAPLRPCPAIPLQWPAPVVHPQCAPLWRQAFAGASRSRGHGWLQRTLGRLWVDASGGSSRRP
jgi:hypothetical protein